MRCGLEGRSALGTGGGAGCGLGCARWLVEDGATVTICGRTEARLRDAAEEIGAHWVVADVTQEDQVHAAVEAATANGGGLHIAVANAGGGMTAGPIVMTALGGGKARSALTLTAPFPPTKHAPPATGRPGGGPMGAMSPI